MIFRLVLTVALCALSACAHTRIAARPIPPEADKLARLAPRSIAFHLECGVDEIVGHQYLLLILPFGRISIEDPARHLANHLVVALAERGIAGYEASAEQASVQIRCEDLSLTAYDYFFVRQIVGRLSWSIDALPESSIDKPIVQRNRTSALKAVAFHSQLEYQLHHLLTEAAESISRSAVWSVVARRQ